MTEKVEKKAPTSVDALDAYTIDELRSYLSQREQRATEEKLKAQQRAAERLAEIEAEIQKLLREGEKISKEHAVTFELDIDGRIAPTYDSDSDVWELDGWNFSSAGC